MDVTAIAKKAARTALNVAGTAKETATLHLGKSQTYNWDTDKNVESGGSDPVVEGVWYKETKTQAAAIGTDSIFLIHGDDAPNGVFEADSLTRTKTGELWQIYQVDPIPTEAVILIRVRK